MVRRREILGGLLAIVLLWFSTISYFVLDICTGDYTKVWIYEGCINNGTVTVFSFCMVEVIVAAWFLSKYFLPLLFGHALWDTFDNLKQQKLVGFIAQIVIRSSCASQLIGLGLGIWGNHMTLHHGMFPNHNAKLAYDHLLKTNEPTTCAQAGMNDNDVRAMRAWVFAKYHMMAVHIWELAFIPGLTLDGWLHHLFVIVVAAIGCQPTTLGRSAEIQPYIDLVGYSFILGASLNALVKACVVMYHYTAPNALQQARWMEASIAGAWFILLGFYLGFPLIVTVYHAKKLGIPTTICLFVLPVVFLVIVEVRLVLVKRSIARNARRKAAERAAQLTCDTEVGQASPLSDHDSSSASRSLSFRILNLTERLDAMAERLDSTEEKWKEAQC